MTGSGGRLFGTRHLLTQAGWAGTLNVIGLALRFGLVVVIAQLAGATGLGLYTLAIAFGSLAALAGRAGLDQAALRFTARYRAMGDPSAIRGLVIYVTLVTLGLSSLMGAALFVASQWIEDIWTQPGLAEALRVMALGVPAVAIGEVWRDCLRGFQDVKAAVALEHVVIPGGGLLVLLGFAAVGSDTALAAVDASVCAYWAAAVIAAAAVRQRMRGIRVSPTWHPREWTSFGLYLSVEGGLLYLLLWTDQLLLGALLTAADVGVYAAAARLAALVAVPLLAVNSILGPTLAALHGAGDHARLRIMYARFTWATGLAGAAIGLGLLAAGPWLLSVFGAEFATGYPVLVIMAAGQVVNAGTGSAGLMLGMTGHVRWRLANAFVVALLNVALNLLLIPPFGIVGSALATALAIVLINLLQISEVRLVLGFWGYDPAQLHYWWGQARLAVRRGATGHQ